VINLQFDQASHLLMGTGPGMTKFQLPGTQRVFEFGGTVEGTTHARQQAWAAAKRFLAALPPRGGVRRRCGGGAPEGPI
jgi:hypothetical protein